MFPVPTGIISAGLMYSFLDRLRASLGERDVAVLVTALNACGLALRADDPAAMKEFVVSVHRRAGEIGRGEGGLTKRAELMLELVCDIKNNKKKAEGGTGGRTAALAPAVSK